MAHDDASPSQSSSESTSTPNSDEDSQFNIARRTRSHVTVHDSVLNDNLDFPDVDRSLYEDPNSDGDTEYKNFLYQCYGGGAGDSAQDANTDDNDPAYIYNDDIFSHGWRFNLDEELQRDENANQDEPQADYYHLRPHDDQQRQSQVHLLNVDRENTSEPTFSILEQAAAPSSASPLKPPIATDTLASAPFAPNLPIASHASLAECKTASPSKANRRRIEMFDNEEFKRVLNQQLRQHIQLLTQTYLLTRNTSNMRNEADEAKGHLNAYMKVFKDKSKPSNLLPALDLVNNLVAPKDLKSSIRLSWRPLPLPESVRTIISRNPNVFIYPSLLPQVAFSFLPEKLASKKPKINFTLNEDKLLAYALHEFKSESSQYAFIASLLMTAKTKTQISNHIKNIKRSPGNENNPIKLYYAYGELPKIDLDKEATLGRCIKEELDTSLHALNTEEEFEVTLPGAGPVAERDSGEPEPGHQHEGFKEHELHHEQSHQESSRDEEDKQEDQRRGRQQQSDQRDDANGAGDESTEQRRCGGENTDEEDEVVDIEQHGRDDEEEEDNDEEEEEELEDQQQRQPEPQPDAAINQHHSMFYRDHSDIMNMDLDDLMAASTTITKSLVMTNHGANNGYNSGNFNAIATTTTNNNCESNKNIRNLRLKKSMLNLMSHKFLLSQDMGDLITFEFLRAAQAALSERDYLHLLQLLADSMKMEAKQKVVAQSNSGPEDDSVVPIYQSVTKFLKQIEAPAELHERLVLFLNLDQAAKCGCALSYLHWMRFFEFMQHVELYHDGEAIEKKLARLIDALQRDDPHKVKLATANLVSKHPLLKREFDSLWLDEKPHPSLYICEEDFDDISEPIALFNDDTAPDSRPNEALFSHEQFDSKVTKEENDYASQSCPCKCHHPPAERTSAGANGNSFTTTNGSHANQDASDANNPQPGQHCGKCNLKYMRGRLYLVNKIKPILAEWSYTSTRLLPESLPVKALSGGDSTIAELAAQSSVHFEAPRAPAQVASVPAAASSSATQRPTEWTFEEDKEILEFCRSKAEQNEESVSFDTTIFEELVHRKRKSANEPAATARLGPKRSAREIADRFNQLMEMYRDENSNTIL